MILDFTDKKKFCGEYEEIGSSKGNAAHTQAFRWHKNGYYMKWRLSRYFKTTHRLSLSSYYNNIVLSSPSSSSPSLSSSSSPSFSLLSLPSSSSSSTTTTPERRQQLPTNSVKDIFQRWLEYNKHIRHTSTFVRQEIHAPYYFGDAFNGVVLWRKERNNFTPKSDQFQISPAAAPATLHQNSVKNLDFHSLFRRKMIILPILTTSLIYISLWKVGIMYHLSLGVKGLTYLGGKRWGDRSFGFGEWDASVRCLEGLEKGKKRKRKKKFSGKDQRSIDWTIKVGLHVRRKHSISTSISHVWTGTTQAQAQALVRFSCAWACVIPVHTWLTFAR